MADVEAKGLGDQELHFEDPEMAAKAATTAEIKIYTLKDKAFYNGIPYEGKQIHIKHDDPKSLQPVLVGKVFTEQFSTAGDLSKYTRIKQDELNKRTAIQFEEREYNKETKSWDILINWVELLYKHPEDKNK